MTPWTGLLLRNSTVSDAFDSRSRLHLQASWRPLLPRTLEALVTGNKPPTLSEAEGVGLPSLIALDAASSALIAATADFEPVSSVYCAALIALNNLTTPRWASLLSSFSFSAPPIAYSTFSSVVSMLVHSENGTLGRAAQPAMTSLT